MRTTTERRKKSYGEAKEKNSFERKRPSPFQGTGKAEGLSNQRPGIGFPIPEGSVVNDSLYLPASMALRAWSAATRPEVMAKDEAEPSQRRS